VLTLNVVMFWCGYTILVAMPSDRRKVWPGAILAGAQLVNHQLRHRSNLYGTFATVLGLMWWLALGTTVSVLGAECNVMLARGAWPRSFRRPSPDDLSGSPEPTPTAAG
jgi:uncharacterized BrkB/YihY/UPF0761 family membrane protein